MLGPGLTRAGRRRPLGLVHRAAHGSRGAPHWQIMKSLGRIFWPRRGTAPPARQGNSPTASSASSWSRRSSGARARMATELAHRGAARPSGRRSGAGGMKSRASDADTPTPSNTKRRLQPGDLRRVYLSDNQPHRHKQLLIGHRKHRRSEITASTAQPHGARRICFPVLMSDALTLGPDLHRHRVIGTPIVRAGFCRQGKSIDAEAGWRCRYSPALQRLRLWAIAAQASDSSMTWFYRPCRTSAQPRELRCRAGPSRAYRECEVGRRMEMRCSPVIKKTTSPTRQQGACIRETGYADISYTYSASSAAATCRSRLNRAIELRNTVRCPP